jgi:hypothetical protein
LGKKDEVKKSQEIKQKRNKINCGAATDDETRWPRIKWLSDIRWQTTAKATMMGCDKIRHIGISPIYCQWQYLN